LVGGVEWSGAELVFALNRRWDCRRGFSGRDTDVRTFVSCQGIIQQTPEYLPLLQLPCGAILSSIPPPVFAIRGNFAMGDLDWGLAMAMGTVNCNALHVLAVGLVYHPQPTTHRPPSTTPSLNNC